MLVSFLFDVDCVYFHVVVKHLTLIVQLQCYLRCYKKMPQQSIDNYLSESDGLIRRVKRLSETDQC